MIHLIKPNSYDKSSLSPAMLAWMTYSGSFMDRLKQHAIYSKVKVLKQAWSLPEMHERHQLNIPPRCYALVREVLIVSENKHWMYARTTLPLNTLIGKEKQLKSLKNRSLGSFLFKYPHLKRSDFLLTCFKQSSLLYQKMTKLISINAENLWGRSSIFTINQKKILLTEIFLPDLEMI